MADSPIVNGWSAVAVYLKVHEQTARKWHAEEGLPVAKISGNIITTTNLLERWIVKHVKLYMAESGKNTET